MGLVEIFESWRWIKPIPSRPPEIDYSQLSSTSLPKKKKRVNSMKISQKIRARKCFIPQANFSKPNPQKFVAKIKRNFGEVKRKVDKHLCTR